VTLWVATFAGRVGRSPGWVREKIATAGIKAFGPPYIIPASELAKFI
jgi:hypothetical protein